MSSTTSTTALLPTLGKRELSVTDIVSREAFSEAVKSPETFAAYRQNLAEVFTAVDGIALKVEGARSLTGAYVWEAARLANGGKERGIGKEVADTLARVLTNGTRKPLSSGMVSRYGNLARLHFRFGFGPEDGQVWSDLVNDYAGESDLYKVLTKEGAQRRDVEAWYAKVSAPALPAPEVAAEVVAAEVGGSAEEATPAGTDTATRGAGAPAVASEPVGNAARLDAIVTNLRAMTPPDADDVAALHGIALAIRDLIGTASDEDRASGRALAEKLHRRGK